MRRAQRSRLGPFQAGILAIVVICVLTYFGFTKSNPFSTPFEVKAVFSNAQNIGKNSPVRIAGVEVGKVTDIEPAEDDAEASVVTMKLKDDGLPIHKDARMKIRPRIFLEGNFFVDVRPGTPDSGDIDDGDTIPMSQTAAPVQLDQVLGALKTDARTDLQNLLKGYGDALAGEPSADEDADQDTATQGETAGESLNDTLTYSPDALRGTAIVNDALLGTELHDLAKLIRGGGRITRALASREEQLKDLVTNFNVTTGALASEENNLRLTIRRLPGVLRSADSAFDNLNEAFPPTRAFAREILPGVRETPATINASFPWIAQTRRLVSPPELQGLVGDLQPAVDDLAQAINGAVELMPQLDDVSHCALDVILPTGDVVIQDGPLTTGIENYKEFFQTLVGLAGESQNFDGNGGYTRFQTGGGTQTVSTGAVPSVGPLFGNALRQPLGTRPAKPAKRPPYNRRVACHRNRIPNLNAARIGGGP
jgi:phospholipid/cholesterol/gamma-HCH transport system substrate-binding protein